MSLRTVIRRPAVMLVLALAAVGALISVVGRLASGPPAETKATTLSAGGGSQAYPALSPDGKRLAYAARESSGEFHLFVRDLPNGAGRRLTSGPASDTGPAWSSDGSNVAFLRLDGERSECMVVSAAGGEPRKISDCGAPDAEQPRRAVAWMPDGKSLVIAAARPDGPPALALISANGGAGKRLTDPPKGSRGDTTPAVSPDGASIAFLRGTDEDGADIFICDQYGGKPRQLTFENHPIRGLAWTPDGRHLVFASLRSERWRLYRLGQAGGSPRDLTIPGKQNQYPSLSLKGDRLAFTESPSTSAIWRAPISAGAAERGAALIRSTGNETNPSYSPDGKRVANLSDQSGASEVWVSDSDGGNRIQITRFAGNGRPGRPRWSPDGSTLLFTVRGQGHPPEIHAVRSTGGEVKRVISEGESPSWSRDGKSIYYTSLRRQVWKAAADGSSPRALTRDFGEAQPEESVDGKFVYYRKGRSIWRVPAQGGDEEEAIDPTHDLVWGGFVPTAKGIYYAEWNRRGRMPAIMLYDPASRKTTAVFEMKNADASAFSISPDGQTILYPRVDRDETTLILVDGFR